MIRKEVPFIDIHTHHCVIASGTQWSAAIHPWNVKQFNLTFLENLLKEDKLVAIGETGIDRLHKETIALQIEMFERHILLSEQYQKPLIIHNVRGTDEILRLHKKYHPKQAWIIHGFNGSSEEAKLFTEKDIFLSVGESLFYPNRKITQSISSISLDHLFLETDTSEKTIQQVYEKAAELLNLPLATLKERIFANFARLNLESWNNGMTEHGCSSATMALINLGEAMC